MIRVTVIEGGPWHHVPFRDWHKAWQHRHNIAAVRIGRLVFDCVLWRIGEAPFRLLPRLR